jgi:hypothetical protein
VLHGDIQPLVRELVRFNVGGREMKAQAHTGWRVAKRGAATIEVVGPHGGTICHMDAKLEDKARLIAAAPDLLAALQMLASDYEEAMKAQGFTEPNTRLMVARAAISKATGVAPSQA